MINPDELDLMPCPMCDSVAEVVEWQAIEVDETPVMIWRTLCLEGHLRQNVWYHEPPVDDGDE